MIYVAQVIIEHDILEYLCILPFFNMEECKCDMANMFCTRLNVNPSCFTKRIFVIGLYKFSFLRIYYTIALECHEGHICIWQFLDLFQI